MELSPVDFTDFFKSYIVYAFILASSFYAAVNWIGHHLSKDAKETLSLWLWGEYESTWSQHFCKFFDTVFGKNHLSWQCFIRSSIASMLTVIFLYILFSEVFGVLEAKQRIGDNLTFTRALILGAVINIIPDYISLFETRWLLKKFGQLKLLTLQLAVLLIDAIFTASIAWISINLFQLLTGDAPLSSVEVLALFSIFSLFFYSTFITSVWAWIFFISTGIMRLFARTGLKHLLDIESKPVSQIALAGAAIIFIFTIVTTPVFTMGSKGKSSAFDELLCTNFPATICKHLSRMSSTQALAETYLARQCEGGDTLYCLKKAQEYYNGDNSKSIEHWKRSCSGKNEIGCHNLGFIYVTGKFMPRDFKQAEEYFNKACELGYGPSCHNLGMLYSKIYKDYTPARKFYAKACNSNGLFGCSNLGIMYLNGQGGSKDITKAESVFRLACNEGDAIGCRNLGIMYAQGKIVGSNATQAKLYFNLACSKGDSIGCQYSAEIKTGSKNN
jgi:uncharacterized protein